METTFVNVFHISQPDAFVNVDRSRFPTTQVGERSQDQRRNHIPRGVSVCESRCKIRALGCAHRLYVSQRGGVCGVMGGKVGRPLA